MKLMKGKLIFFLVAVLLASAVISCSNSGSSSPEKKAQSYTVGFNTGGGSYISPQHVMEGNVAVRPSTNPTSPETYKIFAFWSLDGKTEFVFTENPIKSDITLNAVWRDYKVGDVGPAGGLIYHEESVPKTSTYTDKDGKTVSYTWRYLEVSPVEATVTKDRKLISEFVFGFTKDGYEGMSFDTVGTKSEIGEGRFNTRAIINRIEKVSKNTNPYFASKVCENFTAGGKSDWFLPSIDGLKRIYEHFKGAGDKSIYWSSTENGKYDAYALDFGTGEVKSYDRGGSYSVRPVRAF